MPGPKGWVDEVACSGDGASHEKHYRQLRHRVASPLIREIFTQFQAGTVTAGAAADRLELGHTRFYELYGEFLRVRSAGGLDSWVPGSSGGNHAQSWPAAVQALVRKLLTVRPPAPYRFIASELQRRLNFQLDPASVRRWALAHDLAHPTPARRPAAAWRRWQCLKVGALWQLDASPHAWFPGIHRHYPLLDLLDDCSRVCTGAQIFHGETLLAYLSFLPAAFREHGLPLELYVDCHSFFFPQRPEALTQLGAALHFYGVSLRYARTPQAKGKIERQHLYWQRRLPSLFAAEGISTPEQANPLLNQLRHHRNAHEVHRELARTPNAAAALAKRERRVALRKAPNCPWWPYVWSQRTPVIVGPDGRVPVGTQRLSVPRPPGSRLVQCLHPDGDISILAQEPHSAHKPALLLRVSAF